MCSEAYAGSVRQIVTREHQSEKLMKIKHLLITVVAVGSAALAVQAFYEHPTAGRGIQALLAVIGLRGL